MKISFVKHSPLLICLIFATINYLAQGTGFVRLERKQFNRHLPGIPSAMGIEKNEGFKVGDMQTKLFGKNRRSIPFISSVCRNKWMP